MTWSRAVVATAVLAILGGCATSGTPAQRTSVARPTAPVRTTDGGEPLLSCGGDTFPVSAMVDGVEPRTPEAGITQALDDLVRRAGVDAPMGLSRGGVQPGEWKVLAEDADSLTLATGPWDEDGPAGRAHVVGLEKHGDGWHAAGWGDCRLRPVPIDPAAWATVRASVAHLTPDARSVPVQVTELECTSARGPEPYLHEPFVVETETSVTVYWTTEPPAGAQKCPGNPSVDRVVELEEPLGDRTVLDGSTWPARPVTDQPF